MVWLAQCSGKCESKSLLGQLGHIWTSNYPLGAWRLKSVDEAGGAITNPEKNIMAHITTQQNTTRHNTTRDNTFWFLCLRWRRGKLWCCFCQIFVSELTAGVAEKHGSLLIAVTVGTGGELIWRGLNLVDEQSSGHLLQRANRYWEVFQRKGGQVSSSTKPLPVPPTKVNFFPFQETSTIMFLGNFYVLFDYF